MKATARLAFDRAAGDASTGFRCALRGVGVDQPEEAPFFDGTSNVLLGQRRTGKTTLPKVLATDFRAS